MVQVRGFRSQMLLRHNISMNTYLSVQQQYHMSNYPMYTMPMENY